jgi:hypothetical protein
MWVCISCPHSGCSSCAQIFEHLEDAIEHVQQHHASYVRRPQAVGCPDSYGHLWYCFGCETALRDHRSFNSHEAMLHHLTDRHVIDIVRIDDASMDSGYCSSCGY